MMYVSRMDESRRDRKKRLTRHRIVMTAIRLFEERGYEETTVAQIAAASDVDPKTFFNYFGSKDEVLFVGSEADFDVLLNAIAERRPQESPGEVLRRAVRAYATHRRPQVPPKEPAELSAVARLVHASPALQAKGAHVALRLQRRIAEALSREFGDRLDPITAAAMTGAVLGAIEQATWASIQLGQTQQQLWEAADRALDIATRGLNEL
ncbi:MAG TPA: TetR/AcrR family transcriptional regulator [Stackebrandtia sp.]|jgi:AcrR family transcriptional regulator|uniref:TetR/AcrR family transcriptional regulator n=1 Tax=Stackebrandtia sp. TaxID=2023065 RepID=UPI002D2B147A|nr:TetR/AcrR family transcriptional regulator [Stackebrandtia sp.]HZE38816.1 TetR/AcrR family transcriptional regulator [Stackebrandtia sp.]